MSSSSSDVPEVGPPPSYAAPPVPQTPPLQEPTEEQLDRYKGLMKKKPLKLGGRLAELQSNDGYHRTKSNSTSTLYVNSTVSTPDLDELLRCTSIKIHNFILEGQLQDVKKYKEIFDERVHPITPDFDQHVSPSEMDVYRFIEKIFTAERLSHECVIMMLCYIERILANITMDTTNWRRVVLSTLILASKVWEDQAVWNVDFLNVFPELSVRDLGQLEKILLQLLQFNVSLKSSLYTKYYFELRSLAEKDARNFPLEPLDKQNAKRLEQRSKNEEDRVKASYDASFVRSKSMTSIEPCAVKSPPVVLN